MAESNAQPRPGALKKIITRAIAVPGVLRVEREPGPWFSLAGAILLGLGLVIVHSHHELWRDELHSWTLARNADGFFDILTGIRRYEGHPFLWYYVLHLASRLSRSVVVLHGVTILLAVASSYLWLRDAPLPRFLRVPLLGTYLFFYEYGVLSRSYALGLVCLFLFCRLYDRRASRIPILSLVLVLLALTSAYGALLAVALAIVVYPSGLADIFKAKREGRSRLRTGLCVGAGMLLFELGLLLFWTTSLPPKDGFFGIPGIMETAAIWPALPVRYWLAHFPRCNPGNGIWMVTAALGDNLGLSPLLPWAGVGLFALWLVALRRVPLVALAYAAGVLSLAGFEHYKYAGFIRHFGHYVVLLVACVWLHEKLRAPQPGRLLRWLFGIMLLAQVAAAAVAVKAEIVLPFSGSVEAADYLRSHGLADAPWVGSFDDPVSAIAGYLDRPFRSAEGNRVTTSVIFDRHRWHGIPDFVVMKLAVAEARQAGRPAILILNRDLGEIDRDEAIVEPLYRTAVPIVADEQFRIFRVRPAEQPEPMKSGQ